MPEWCEGQGEAQDVVGNQIASVYQAPWPQLYGRAEVWPVVGSREAPVQALEGKHTRAGFDVSVQVRVSLGAVTILD